MSKMRKFEREMIRTKSYNETHSNKNFGHNWREFRDAKYTSGDGDDKVVNTPKNTQKKKKPHFDNKKSYIDMLRFYKNLRESAAAKKAEQGSTSEIVDSEN